MSDMKAEWDKYVTPKIGVDEAMQVALDWWWDLCIQNLYDMDDSWVGYLWKYYPEKEHPYHLTGEEVQHIYEKKIANDY
tara:strand:- start:19095 stop:19331 length:237 start_codon:yes stop_codon:yes gene_type:complete